MFVPRCKQAQCTVYVCVYLSLSLSLSLFQGCVPVKLERKNLLLCLVFCLSWKRHNITENTSSQRCYKVCDFPRNILYNVRNAILDVMHFYQIFARQRIVLSVVVLSYLASLFTLLLLEHPHHALVFLPLLFD